jgi:hypothetical protein
MMKYFIQWRTSMKNKMESAGLEPQTIDAECQLATHWAIWDTLLFLFIKIQSLFPRKNTIFLKFSKCFVGAKMYSMVRIRYVHMGLWKLPRFGAFFVLKGTAFRCFILEPVPDVPLVRLWGSIGTRIPIWDNIDFYPMTSIDFSYLPVQFTLKYPKVICSWYFNELQYYLYYIYH